MTDPAVFHPLFDCDVREAADWYDGRSATLGEAFVAAAKATVNAIKSDPRRFPKLEGELRFALLDRFPYVVLFECEADRLYLAGLFHAARDPAKWRERAER